MRAQTGGGALGDRAAVDVPDGFAEWTPIASTLLSDVYRARQRSSGRLVAVKLLRASLGDETRRLFVEGCRAAELVSTHPLVVSLVAVGETPAGRPWLATEFHPRGCLGSYVRRHGLLAPQHGMSVIVRVADTLAYAHEAGVLHRDVKPGNILISATSDPVLTDFQTAAVLRPGHLSATVSSLTDDYAAPEVQIDNRYSVRSEVFAIAATLMEIVCGAPPFRRREGESQRQWQERLDAGVFPEDAVPTGTPAALVAVLRAGLARDPGDRPATAAALASALRGAQAELGHPVTPELAVAPPAARRDDSGSTRLRATAPRSAPVSPAPARAATSAATGPRRPSRLLVVGGVVAAGCLVGGGVALVLDTMGGAPPGPVAVAAAPVEPSAPPTPSVEPSPATGIVLPRLADTAADAAEAALRDQGLVVRVREEESGTTAEGRVVRTQPAAGSQVSPGDPVVLVVSRGAQRQQAEVPPVVDLDRTGAERLLRQVGLRVRVVARASDSVPAGRAITTQPEAGEDVDVGSVVALVMSTGPTPSPSGTETPQATATAAAARPPFPGTVAEGAQGQAVRDWQELLIRDGAIRDVPENRDGWFGPGMAEAVRRLETERGLPDPDGVADEATYELLVPPG